MTSITRLHKDSRRSCLSNKSSKRKRRKTSSLCPASRCPPLLISQSKATSVTLQFDLDWIISLCVALCFVSPWLLCLCCCCCSGLTSEYPWKDCQIIHVVSVVNHPVLTKTLWIAAYILSLCVDARRWMSHVPIVQDQMPSLRFFTCTLPHWHPSIRPVFICIYLIMTDPVHFADRQLVPGDGAGKCFTELNISQRSTVVWGIYWLNMT